MVEKGQLWDIPSMVASRRSRQRGYRAAVHLIVGFDNLRNTSLNSATSTANLTYLAK